MDSSIARRLVRLNLEFYETFAGEFSASRHHLQPGIERALAALEPFDSLLDVGCGDARVGIELRERGWTGRYLGVDNSRALLRSRLPGGAADLATVEMDLTDQPAFEPGFAAAVCFSVLQHVPGAPARQALVNAIAAALAPGARSVFSAWQFLHHPRFERKIQPWSRVGLTEADVDRGDHLVDWQRGGEGLRYVHHLDEEELTGLCTTVGLEVEETYLSDGQPGDLGLYVVARRAQ